MVELNINLPGVVMKVHSGLLIGTTLAHGRGHWLGQAISCSVAWWLPWGEVAYHVTAQSPPSGSAGHTQFTLQIPHLNQHMNKRMVIKPPDNVAIAFLTSECLSMKFGDNKIQ